MSKFRFVAIHPSRVGDRKKIGPASFLHDFLVDHQTDAEGNVNYRKPFCYAWIRARWPDAPPVRTLRRHMARLKACGYVWVERAGFDRGMRVRILGSAKWQQAPAQTSLFPSPAPLSISSGKAVQKRASPSSHVPPKVAALRGQKWPRNEVKNLREETTKSDGARFARSAAVEK